MSMEETPPARLRRNIKFDGIFQTTIIIFSLIILVMAFVHIRTEDVTKTKAKTRLQTKAEMLAAEVNEKICQLSREPQLNVESIELVTVTSSVDTDPENVEVSQDMNLTEIESEKVYKSIEEVRISRDMDLTETTGLSREDFCELLANFKYDYVGFYNQNAGLIWDLSQEYQINEIFICAVFALESGFGRSEKHIIAHNYGSIMRRKGGLVKYSSDEEGIEANYKLFADCYLNPDGKYYKGVTLDSIGDTYCPPTKECPSWARKVYNCMKLFLE